MRYLALALVTGFVLGASSSAFADCGHLQTATTGDVVATTTGSGTATPIVIPTDKKDG